MGEFKRVTQKFVANGQNWNRSIDTIPDGQIAFGRNIRAGQQGEITTRAGLTSFATPTGVSTYVHSISRLNNYSPALPFFTDVFVVGGDQVLLAGKTGADLANASINPLTLPAGITLSGNPLSMVDSATESGASGWKFVGDSGGMVEVGYYPGDTPGTNPARALTVGMIPPVVTAIFAITISGPGLLLGNYQWAYVFRRLNTGAQSNPSAAGIFTYAQPGYTLTNQFAQLTLPLTPVDPLTGSPDTHIVVDVYRFGGTVFKWSYVGTGISGATFTDNLPDVSVLSEPGPSTIADPNTGVTRYNLNKPFVTQDVARFGTATARVTGNGIWWLQWASGNAFNEGWLQGSFISVNNANFTIYEVTQGGATSGAEIVLGEDATGTLVAGTMYSWSTQGGTLTMGAPLPHLWGPYGTGVQGSVIFGCGDPNAAGTLYWTNGNDPDSQDLANSLVVTSPSERLTGGCVFNGISYCFSTERMFQIFPSLTVAGQYYVQEVVGGKGLWMEWSLTVQSNSIADQSISWRGKDGIYNYTPGGGTQSLTDDTLYPFFPQANEITDNQQGTGFGAAIGTANTAGRIFPFLNATESVPPPDDTQAKYHRLSWFDGVLFYDFVGLVSNTNLYSALVFDAKQSRGWISVDQYFLGAKPAMRSPEIGGNNLKIAVGSLIYDYAGADDTSGNVISCRCVTRQDDQQDARGEKLYGDLMFDADPGGSAGTGVGIDLIPLADYGATQITSKLFTVAGRAQTPVDLSASGLGYLSRTFGLDIQWTGSGTPTALYQYVYSYVPKPEILNLRALDKTDDGWNGAKYIRGFCIECNTFNQARKVNILVDGVKQINPITGTTVFTINTVANTQAELPFGIKPAVAYELQIAIDSSDTSTAGWEIFSVRWVWEKWQDLDQKDSAVLYIGDGTGRAHYLRGFTLPIDTNGLATPNGFTVLFDAEATSPGYIFAPAMVPTTPPGQKTPVKFTFQPPLVAHTAQFQPSQPWRAWYDEIVWDAEAWPNRAPEYGPWTDLGTVYPKYLRGVTLPVETGGLIASIQVIGDFGAAVTLAPDVQTAPLAKSAFTLLPSSPLIGYEFQLRTLESCRAWFGDAKWDAEVWPPLSLEVSPFQNCGYKGAKFFQGGVIPMDTNGLPVFLKVAYDASDHGPQPTPINVINDNSIIIGPFTTPAGVKTPIPFSFSPDNVNPSNPFIAHEVQLIPQEPVRVWWDEIEWRWEPAPELAYSWVTQQTDFDLPGYHSMRDAWIAYIGGTDQPVLTISAPWETLTYTLPASNGSYVRVYLPLQPQKAQYRTLRIDSTQGIRLFKKDVEVRVKAWGDTGGYRSAQPFGDESRTVGARI